ALSAHSRHRRSDRGDLRDLIALHHGPGRHAFLWACRVFRPWRIWGGAAGQMAGRSDGCGTLCGTAGRPRRALLFGWFAVRLSGVYLAMLTLAFAQIVWALVFQWETLTGGSNGVIGVWPPPPFDKAWVYFLLTLVLATIGVLLLRRFLF